MKLTLICVGRLKSGPESELCERYVTRCQPLGRTLGLSPFEIVELPESRSRRPEDRKAEEAQAILAKAGDARLILFDERGKSPSTQNFADMIGSHRDGACEALALVIGGADGLDASLRDKAQMVVSFGAMTIPHQLVRVLVSEQLYRVMTWMSGHPYHRV